MKNSCLYFIIIFCLFFQKILIAENLQINSSKVNLDKESQFMILEGNVSANDDKNNIITTDYATYDKKIDTIETKGKTKIITSQGYQIFGSDVTFDNKKKIISSENETEIIDKDGNQIKVEMFKYIIETSIFFSKGKVNVLDINNNIYNFSEIYIDEKENKMVGSDVKAFLNDESLKNNTENDPRFFANTVSITKNKSIFNKGIFTYCKIDEEKDCPPWTIQSEKIEHSSTQKTIYYKNAVLKVYDFPIFYFPKFSHPDPSVKRKSGFLAPNFQTNTTVGSGISVPYFVNISRDKDLTLTPKLYFNENPLLLAEYRQSFKNSFLIVDAGYTNGYRESTLKKTKGSRAHFFSKFNLDLSNNSNETKSIDLKIQRTNNDTYFKIHDINTSLVENDINILENTLDYTYELEDLYFGANMSVFENITRDRNEKFEYLLPVNLEKNLLISENYGALDLSSNLVVRNYEVNKQTEFLVNDFNWNSNKWVSGFGLENQIQGKIKTVAYNAQNDTNYKIDEKNAELSSVVGLMTKYGLYKNDKEEKNIFSLVPKTLVRYAPGHMRRVDSGRLKYSNIFDLNKLNQIDVIENGMSASVGVDFKKNEFNKSSGVGAEKFSISLGQVINEKENKDMPSKSSLDQRFSDVVGESALNLNNNLALKYNFAIDQSYKELNYNEVGADLEINKAKFNISYLEEKNHIGSNEYVQSDIKFAVNNSNTFNFSTKRNLVTNSSEFYNLSYNYSNDCLTAGIAYRREFYEDRDLEPANRLMFTISIVPFAILNSPNVKR